MKWRGDKPTIGTFGPTPEQYGNFASSIEKAPFIVPGQDRPFQFEHWTSGTLNRGGENDFKVFLGNIGSGVGMFTSVDDKFLPTSDYVIATLIYKDTGGIEREARFNLKDRC